MNKVKTTYKYLNKLSVRERMTMFVSFTCVILFLVAYFTMVLTRYDAERATAALTSDGYTNVKIVGVASMSSCAWHWNSKSVIARTQFFAEKGGKNYTGAVCSSLFYGDRIVLDEE